MPTNMTPDPTFGGAVNSKGLVSLQRGLTAADAGTKFFGFDPASILFSSALRYILGRGRDWPEAVETTPEMQVEALYDYLQQTEGQIPEGGTEGRDATWGGLLERSKELGMNDITNQLMQRPEVANQFSGNPIEVGKNTADALLSQIKEFLPFYDQSQVVLNPSTGQATIVFGTPPSGSPVIQAGNLPQSNTNVGVTTGIPIIDQAINSVLKKPGGLESGSIRDEVIKVISEQAGLDPATTAGILGEDLETILATANADVANTASRFGIDLTREKEEVTGDTGTPVVKEAPSDQQTAPVKNETADSVDTVLSGGNLTPADLGESSSIIKETPITVETAGGGAATPGVPSSLYGQGMQSVKTKKAGLADVGDVFDIEDLSLANVISLLTAGDDNTQRAPYYGGSANRTNSVDELIRLLRG